MTGLLLSDASLNFLTQTSIASTGAISPMTAASISFRGCTLPPPLLAAMSPHLPIKEHADSAHVFVPHLSLTSRFLVVLEFQSCVASATVWSEAAVSS